MGKYKNLLVNIGLFTLNTVSTKLRKAAEEARLAAEAARKAQEDAKAGANVIDATQQTTQTNVSRGKVAGLDVVL